MYEDVFTQAHTIQVLTTMLCRSLNWPWLSCLQIFENFTSVQPFLQLLTILRRVHEYDNCSWCLVSSITHVFVMFHADDAFQECCRRARQEDHIHCSGRHSSHQRNLGCQSRGWKITNICKAYLRDSFSNWRGRGARGRKEWNIWVRQNHHNFMLLDSGKGLCYIFSISQRSSHNSPH